MQTLISQIPPFVIQELNNRRKVITANSPVNNELLWMQSKTPWIKMQSNAVLDNMENEKNKLILYSSWLNAGNSAQFDGMYTTAALRPQPGITELHSNIKGHMGIMREVTVKFKAYTIYQLELLQDLYMTPGIGVLIEWGWSLAYSLNSKGELSEAEIPSLNLYKLDEGSEDNRWLRKTIQEKISQGRGLYDAVFGLICNFNISFVEDGTWDCETTILGPGAMTVDINLKSPSNALDEKLTAFFEDRVNFEIQGKNTETPYLGCAAFKAISDDLDVYKSPELQQREKEETERKKNEPPTWNPATGASLFSSYGTGTGQSAKATSLEEDIKSIKSEPPLDSDRRIPGATFVMAKGSSIQGADPTAIMFGNEMARMLSDDMSEPLEIDSIYRTIERNEEVGGRMDSFHLKGKALDFKKEYWAKLSEAEKQKLLTTYGYEAVVETTHVHVEPKGPSTSTPVDKPQRTISDRVPPPVFSQKKSLKPFEIDKTNVYVTWEFIENTLNKFFETDSGINYTSNKFIDSFVPISKEFENTSDPRQLVIPCMDFTMESDLWRSFTPTDVLIPTRPSQFLPKNVMATMTSKEVAAAGVQTRVFPFDIHYGDLASVWINYNVVVKPAFQNNETIQSALNEIINKMNNAAGGIWNLMLMYDSEGYVSYRVVDLKCTYAANEQNIDPYEFDLNERGSIIRNASVNMIIPNALKATVMIASNAPEGQDIESSIADRDMVGVFRGLTRGVRDRFAMKRNAESHAAIEAKQEATTKKEKEREEQRKKERELIDAGKKRGWHEILAPNEKAACINKIFRYIENVAYWLDNLATKEQKEAGIPKFNAIIPLDLTLTLDGIAGLTWGNAFNISYLPTKYKKNAIFQIKDITHDVTTEGWTTTIVGMMRPTYNQTAQTIAATITSTVNLDNPSTDTPAYMKLAEAAPDASATPIKFNIRWGEDNFQREKK